MKKIYVISLIVLILMVSFLGITYSYEYNANGLLIFKLNGETTVNLLVGEDYIEYGASAIYGNEDISSLLKIDNSMIDTNKVGVYKVKYEIIFDDYSEYIYRYVRVYENIAPKVILKGDSVIYIKLNENYYEPGYEIIDNYDMDLSKNVIVTSNVDVTKVGEYEIEYLVTDNSGNVGSIIRKVIILE